MVLCKCSTYIDISSYHYDCQPELAYCIDFIKIFDDTAFFQQFHKLPPKRNHKCILALVFDFTLETSVLYVRLTGGCLVTVFDFSLETNVLYVR